MLRPALTKVATGGPSPRLGIIGPPSRPLGGIRLSHTPERSGMPAARRGAGALRLGVPSALRGTSGRRNAGHCAASDTENAKQPARMMRRRIGRKLYLESLLPLASRLSQELSYPEPKAQSPKAKAL